MMRHGLTAVVLLGWASLFPLLLHTQGIEDRAPPCKDNIGEKGPLLTENVYPFYIPFINLHPESARTLGTGRDRFSLLLNYSNTFRYDFSMIRWFDNFTMTVDTETARLSLSYDYGFLPWLDLGLDCSLTAHYGGFCDAAIQFFHNFLGFHNSSREFAENNTFELIVKNDYDNWVYYTLPVVGFGDIQLRSKINLVDLRRAGFALALQPAIKFPTGAVNYFLSNGKLDFSFQVLLTQTLFRSAIYLNVGYIYAGKPDNIKIVGFWNHLLSYVLALELIVSREMSLYAQVDGSTSPYRAAHFWLDKHSTTLNLGFKKRFNANYSLQVGFSEEFLTFATTDIGMIVALIIED